MSDVATPFEALTEKEKRAMCPVPEPKRPGRDWRWFSLWIPPVVSAVGLFLFGILAFSFTQLRDLPLMTLRRLVLGGAICMAFGGELGTPFAIFEVFRKYKSVGATLWDWTGLVVSLCSSITSIILGWAWLLAIDTTWSPLVQTYGPLFLGVLATADFTVNAMEAGLYLGSRDERRDKWEEKYYRPWREWVAGETGWAQKMGAHPPAVPTSPDQLVATSISGGLAVYNGKQRQNHTYDPFVFRVHPHEDHGWKAKCACGWEGRKTYDARGKAISAIAGHRRTCKAEWGTGDAESVRIGREDEEGDF